jgi:hypothetical protein
MTDTSDIYSLFETDRNRETEGVWHPVTPKIKFLLARAGGTNTAFAKIIEAKTRKFRRPGVKIEDMQIDPESGQQIMIEAFAETIVLDWVGVTNRDDGKAIKFSKAAVVKLLTDLPDLFIELQNVAANMATYRVASIKADSGN